ncbi:MAG: hypothetical protein MI861_08785 [Pirellulales bacterium]|nr:hypothetical protein [Pirellulales bacterium]
MNLDRVVIPPAGIQWCREQIGQCALFLAPVRQKSDAAILYNLSADSLEWSDEYPDIRPQDTAFNQFYSALLHIRTSLILGEGTTDELRAIVELMRENCPDWPGLLAGRFDPVLGETFWNLKAESMDSVRNFPTNGASS